MTGWIKRSTAVVLPTERISRTPVGDGPPLIFTSWWVSHVELDWSDPAFRAFFESLAQRHLVVRYDRPGAGLSGLGEVPFRYATRWVTRSR